MNIVGLSILINTVSSSLAGIFAVWFLCSLIRKKGEWGVKLFLLKVFTPIAIGYTLYGLAQILYTLATLSSNDALLFITDPIWIVGYVFVLIGFGYFSISIYKKKGRLNEGIIYTIVTSLVVAGILFYLIGKFIVGFQEGESAWLMFLDYFYPIMSGLILLSTVSVYIFFREFKEIGKPLLNMAVVALIYFIGDIIYTYYTWNGLDGPFAVTSNGLYIVGDIIMCYAFYKLINPKLKYNEVKL